MVGGLYLVAGSARAEQPFSSEPGFDLVIVARPALLDRVADEENAEGVIDPETGLRMGPLTVRRASDANVDQIIDEETGLRMGPLTVRRLVITEDARDLDAPQDATDEAPEDQDARPAVRRATRSRTAAAPIPRLHPEPGRHVILTARAMRNEPFRGSCYAYLSEVFSRAGHAGWRNRTIVHRSGTAGPYADLHQIRPGDWLYIVNHPESTPVGTHSVLFVGWEDRASGYARVIEHPGWGAATTGRERGYDVSRTYRIVRPILPQ